MPPMLSAAYYTRHNTEIFFLVLFAVLALATLINYRVRSHRHRELPYGIRPITDYNRIMNEMSIPYDLDEWIKGEMSTWPMVDAWKLIEPDFQIENV